MNLLLLLSALLSALTGANLAARAPAEPAVVAQAIAAVRIAPAAIERAAHPVEPPAGLARLAVAPVAAALVLGRGIPAFASRRRE